MISVILLPQGLMFLVTQLIFYMLSLRNLLIAHFTVISHADNAWYMPSGLWLAHSCAKRLNY